MATKVKDFFGLGGWACRFDMSGKEQWNQITDAKGPEMEPLVGGGTVRTKEWESCIVHGMAQVMKAKCISEEA